LETDSDEAGSSTVTKTLIPTWTLTLTEDMAESLLLLLKVGGKCIFGQGHKTLGILVVSILSLEVPVN